MNSSNFNKFIEDFSSITSSDSNSFERILRKYPYFQTATLFLAKSNPIPENTQKAALRSADRRVLRTWLDDEYRKKLEREKQEVEAKQIILEVENTQNNAQNLDINTDSINAFEKFVETENKEPEIIIENTLVEVDKKENTLTNNFFDEINKNESEIKEPIFKEQSDINEPLENSFSSEIPNQTTDANFFDEIEENDEEIKEPIFKEQSDINEPLENSFISEIPNQTTDANFFDEIEENDEEIKSKEPIFKEQSDINEPLENSFSSEIPNQTTDANFFDEIDENEEEIKLQEPIFKEQSDINEPLENSFIAEIPNQTTDANFFDEIEGDDSIFGEAQKDLDAYDFPNFENEKEELEKNKKVNENKKEDEGGSFFDDI